MHCNKSSFRAAFFLTILVISSQLFASVALGDSSAIELKHDFNLKLVSESPTWAALVHFREKKLQIKDRSFILSFDDFSLEKELFKTIELLSGPDRQTGACRYPARYFWIQTQLKLPKLEMSQCSDFLEYTQKVPAERISLIFASENLNQPSSMMGHIFLQLSGRDTQNLLRKHSISFYTEAATLNLPKLLVENFVTGMKGFYALAPYEEALHQYSIVENRTVWEYQLDLDQFQLELMRRHLYELRAVKFKYYFHSYNCASLIKELLVLVNPDVTKYGDLWTTPKDVLKHAKRANLIASTRVILATQWSLRSLVEILPEQDVSNARLAVEKNEPLVFESTDKNENNYLSLEFARRYNDLLYEQKKITFSAWKSQNSSLADQKVGQRKDYVIEVADTANPVNSPEDSQISVGSLLRGGRRFVQIGFLPASHTLFDDQIGSFSESELKLFELVVLQAQERNEQIIDKLNLYSTRSLIPWSRLSGGLSGGVKMAYENQYDQTLSPQHAATFSGDAGLSLALGKDINLHALAGGGVGTHSRKAYLQASVLLGVIIREVAGMKSIISIEKYLNPLGNSGSVSRLNFGQKIGLSKKNSIELSWTKILGHATDAQVIESSVLYKYTF